MPTSKARKECRMSPMQLNCGFLVKLGREKESVFFFILIFNFFYNYLTTNPFIYAEDVRASFSLTEVDCLMIPMQPTIP